MNARKPLLGFRRLHKRWSSWIILLLPPVFPHTLPPQTIRSHWVNACPRILLVPPWVLHAP